MSNTAKKTAEAAAKKLNNNKKEKAVKKAKAAPEATLTVRPMDFKTVTRDASMIDRELVCKQSRYLIDFNHKGKTFTVSSMWVPGTGAADIQIECERAVLDGLKEYDLEGIVKYIAKAKSLNAKPQNTIKRRKQIARQWVRHTIDRKTAAKLARG